uniref:Integrase catalytic domain-containing protein n=1 Tax=Fagus sylvatica TaxID=28930 RepID=A0A2N9GBC9_FAGSY
MKPSQRRPVPCTIWPLPDRRRVTGPPRVARSDDLRKATWMTERHKTPFSLRTQAGPKLVPLRSPHFLLQVFRSVACPDCRLLVSLKHQLAPSVGIAHICLSPHQYKRTAWSGRDRWKYTLKRFVPSSQSPEVAAMEKQVRDLTTNLQELTRQNQVLNQKLLQHEIEKQKEKDKGKRRAAKHLDDLVHTMDSPFTKAIIFFPLPSKFRMPSLETFDGSKDPLDHLESFKTVMCLQEVPEEIMCRAFPTTLKGPARVWFKKITSGSVGSFAQLSHLFFNHFIGGQRYGRPTTHLLNIKQKEGETLRSYVTRFNKETLLVDGADDKVVLTAFISGLQAGDFLFSVYKDPPSTMTEMMYEAQRHMNGEEALLARDQTIGKKRKWEHPDRPAESHETRPKAQQNRNRRQEDRSGRGFNERFNHFTPLNAPVDHIFMQIRNDPSFEMAGQVVDGPRQKAERQRFVERGQREGRPQGTRQQRPLVEVLPRPPPLGEIHVITGGVAAGGTSRSSRKAYARQIHNVLVTQKMDKKPRLEDLPITFVEEDARKGRCEEIKQWPENVTLTSTSTEPVHQALIVEERQNIAEPTEELEEIVLVKGLHNEKKTTRIGTSMTEGVRDSIVRFLRENADIFAWSHADMPGISTNVVAHQLNVNPSFHPVKQKRRVFAPERNAAIMEEVDKLLKAGFIREVYYPEWLTNVVMPFDLKNAGATYQRLVNKMFHDQIGRNVEVYVDDMLVKSKKDDNHLADLKETFQALRRYNMKLNPAKCVFGVSSWRSIVSVLGRIRFGSQFRSDPRRGTRSRSLSTTPSRTLRGAEERYTNMEKLAFALLIASRKLRPYFQAHSIIVMTDYPIRKAMNKPDAGRKADTVLRFRATNNEAEYEALLAGLKLSKSMGIKALTVKSDSQLIVGQVKGEYEAKEDRMKKYLTVVKDLLTHFEKVELLQIPREDNVAADHLARLASSGIEIDGFIEIQGRPSTEEEETGRSTQAQNKSFSLPVDGGHPLQDGLSHDPTLDVCHLKKRTMSSKKSMMGSVETIQGQDLWRTSSQELAITGRLFYMTPPNMLKLATSANASPMSQRVPPEEITPITSPWPFAQWGLDVMGPFPNVKSFVWKAVICRFGIPRVLISNNGKQFDNGPFREMCSQLNIKNHYSSPRHPQANGQVEVTNRTLLKQIKTRLEGVKRMWVEELPSVLWAYQTTVRTPTKETPFKLTFGTEAVIPVEIGLTTFRTTFHREEENEGQLRLNLDLLDETSEKAAQRIALYQGRMARYYNTKVKLRRFEVDDWVLRKVTQATKDPSQGKLGPNWEGPYKGHPILPKGHLSSRRLSWKEATPSLER